MKTTMKSHWIRKQKKIVSCERTIEKSLWLTKLERSLNHESRNQKLWRAENKKSFMNHMNAIMKNHWTRNQENLWATIANRNITMIKALERFMSHERYFTLWTAKATMWTRNGKQEDWLNEAKHGVK
jgi:hypothetical protein